MSFSTRPTIKKENLARGENFSLDVVIKNNYTHAVQISHLPSEEILQTIPFDPTDRTVAGSIAIRTLDVLGDEVQNFLNILSETLQRELGAKEFITVPVNVDLPGFISPEDSTFTRFRHADREQLYAKTTLILEADLELKTELDRKYCFATNENSLMNGCDIKERYVEVNSILEQARFTDAKMVEYRDEELQGKMSRLKSEYIKPIIMLDKQGNIAGMVRVLLMDNGFAYLCDEVINQEIIPLERFAGASIEEQKYNREVFLLAYLMRQADILGLKDQTHLFIIAADSREKIYDEVGYQAFSKESVAQQTFSSTSTEIGYKVVMKLGPPGPTLKNAQETIKQLPLPEPAGKNQAFVGVSQSFSNVGLFACRPSKVEEYNGNENIYRPPL